VNIDECVLEQQQLESAVKIEGTKSSDLRLSTGNVESIDKEPFHNDEIKERIDVDDVAAMDGSTKSEGFLKLHEIAKTDDVTFSEESCKDVIVIEDLDVKEKSLLGSGDVESLNQKLLAREQAQHLIDDICTSGLEAAASRFNALIAGIGDIETTLAGDNLASTVIAGDLIDVGDVLAVFPIGVTTERRSNSATTTYSPVLSIAIGAARTNHLQLSASPVISTQS